MHTKNYSCRDLNENSLKRQPVVLNTFFQNESSADHMTVSSAYHVHVIFSLILGTESTSCVSTTSCFTHLRPLRVLHMI